MNNKGFATLLNIMLGVVIILISLFLVGPVGESVDIARNGTVNQFYNSTGMDCYNETISDFQKAACTSTDLFTPLWLGFLIGLAGVIFIARLVIR